MSPVAADPERRQVLRASAGDYLAALLAGDLAAAHAAVANALLSGVPSAEVYARVVAAALNDVGRLWELGELSIADEHMASEITSGVLSLPGVRTARGSHSAVVACLTSEGHALGSKAVARAFAEAGWDVLYLGGHTPLEALVMLVAARSPGLVVLSVKLDWHLDELRDAVRAIRALSQSPAILVGGNGVRSRGDILGADAVTDDLADALAWAARTFPAAVPPA